MGCQLTSNSASCAEDPCAGESSLIIHSFVATPTESESVTLINCSDAAQDLTGWTLWDSNALDNGNGEKSLDASGTLEPDASTAVTSLPFTVNDTDETITLKDETGVVIDTQAN